jgi:hypothetical protein
MKKKFIAATAPHIGNLLKQHIRQNRLRRAAIARHMGRSYATVFAYQQSKSMQTAILWELCLIIEHNFFADLAAQLPPHFTTNAPDPAQPLKERLAALEEQVKLLARERDLLKELIKK